ncbi:MAG TPA: ABC transporter permease subunit, partial [Gemmataceae bacterium]|nr:ABC transporter permease subunit [Gemmataceae bacterium]
EIVLGKWLARVVFVVGVVLTGLPALALTMFFGGVDDGQLLAGYAITLLTILSLGAFSLYLAVVSDGLRETMVRAYLVVAGLTIFGSLTACLVLPAHLSPFSALWVLFAGWPDFSGYTPVSPGWVAAGYAIFHLPAAALCLGLAANRVRPAILGLADPTPWVGKYLVLPRDDDLRPVAGSNPVSGQVIRERHVPALTDDEDPLVWKEQWFGGQIWFQLGPKLGCVWLTVMPIIVTFVIVLLPLLALGVRGETYGEVIGPGVRVATAATLPGLVIGLGVLAAGTVVRERQRRTLESLLALPVERSDILRAKARTVVHAMWALASLIGGFVLIGVFTGGAAVSALLAGPLVVLGWGAFALGFGMWLSVRCRTPPRATGYFLGVVLSACVAAPLVSPLARGSMPDPDGRIAMTVEEVIDGLGPVSGGWNTLARPHSAGGLLFLVSRGSIGAAVGALIAGLIGAAFWRSAVRRFENEGR